MASVAVISRPLNANVSSHMRSRRLAAAAALVTLAISGGAYACVAPQPGYGMDRDDLISAAETIVLVRLRSSISAHPQERKLWGHWTEYTLETVEVIKGKANSSYKFRLYYPRASDNDFAGHTAKEFWEQRIGRSADVDGSCYPAHTFSPGRLYLYFPDKLAAVKSAEVIYTEGDKWLGYVRSKVKMAANPALQGTR